MTKNSFSVFACGFTELLGVGETDLANHPLTYDLKKVVIPEDVKQGQALWRFSSSSSNHIIETVDSHFIWGRNDNRRLSKELFIDVNLFLTPVRVFKNTSLVGTLDRGTNTVISNFGLIYNLIFFSLFLDLILII